MANKDTIVLCSNFIGEVGAAAFYVALNEKAVLVSMSPKNAESYDFILNEVKKICIQNDNPKKIIAIGTYWSFENLTKLLTDISSLKMIYCYHPGKVTEPFLIMQDDTYQRYGQSHEEKNKIPSINWHVTHPNILTCSGEENRMNSAYFLREMVSMDIDKNSVHYQLFMNTFAPVIDLLEQNFQKPRNKEIDYFFSGIYNYPRNEDDDFSVPFTLPQKFERFYKGQIKFDKLMEFGRIITEAMRGIAENRAENNSDFYTLNNGIKVAVGTGNDLTEITHSFIHQKYPDAGYTLLINPKFSTGKSHEMAYSARAYLDGCDALRFLGTVIPKEKLGGSSTEAGGRIEFNYIIPGNFIPDHMTVTF